MVINMNQVVTQSLQRQLYQVIMQYNEKENVIEEEL
jgi:hypothetical protein